MRKIDYSGFARCSWRVDHGQTISRYEFVKLMLCEKRGQCPQKTSVTRRLSVAVGSLFLGASDYIMRGWKRAPRKTNILNFEFWGSCGKPFSWSGVWGLAPNTLNKFRSVCTLIGWTWKIWWRRIGSQRIFANLQKNCCFISGILGRYLLVYAYEK